MKPIRGTNLNLSQPLARGLFNCYLFNEGAGARVLDCAEGRLGSLVNNVTWLPAKGGVGLRFAGNNDYIQFATNEPRCNAAAGFSWATRLMFWQLPSVAGANGYGPAYQVAAGYAWTLYGASATNTLRATMRDAAANNYTSGTLGTITIDRWFDVAASFNGTVLSLYVDGVQVDSLSPGSALAGTGVMLRWGLGSTQSPTAVAEHCMFWGRALTDAEARRVTMDPYCMFRRRSPLIIAA